MSLVSNKDIIKILHLEKTGVVGRAVAWVFLRVTRISKVNSVYDQVKHLKGSDFFKKLLSILQISYEIPKSDLKHIPKEGAFITISNHPLGGVDGIVLLKALTELRPDYKITANFLLKKIEPIAPFLISVNPFEDKNGKLQSMGASRLCLQHIKNGKPLGFFPAGEVSTLKHDTIYIDKKWSPAVIQIIKKSNIPVIPIYFHCKNSKLFYFLSNISGLLRTLKLPSETFNKKNKPLKIRIGKPIQPEKIASFEDNAKLNKYLRQKTYILANSYNPKNPLKEVAEKLKIQSKPKKIVKPTEVKSLVREIEQLRKNKKCLIEVKNYEVFFTQTKDIPNILHEIGRLREITFRKIGEGTNKSIDIDAFDNFYHHLFLWDKEQNKLAGAYRMGLGHKIYPKFGTDGFYITTLFEFDPELNKMLSESIEMGRAFIIEEYQQRPMPLFLLWKGIIHVTLRFPQNKYLIGGVSISNQFSNFSKSLMIEFMKSNYYDPFVAQYIHPKKEYKIKLKDADKDFVFDHMQADLQKFDKFINEIEPEGLRIPVLIKKYVKQNAKLVAFNVDPKFNDAIDGLMYIRIADIPKKTVKPVLEEYQKALLLDLNKPNK